MAVWGPFCGPMPVLQTLHLLLLALLFAGALRSDACASRCDVSSCPSPSCPGAYVPDRCNCCLVCSPREGDPCGRKNDAPCADGLVCKPLAADRRRGSKRVCRCKTEHKVCGSDGKTYGNVCRMRAASRKARRMGRGAVSQAHRGACSPAGAGAGAGRSVAESAAVEGGRRNYLYPWADVKVNG